MPKALRKYQLLFNQSAPTQPTCLWCLKGLQDDQDILHLFYQNDVLCMDCRRRYKAKRVRFHLGALGVEGLYPYEGMAREVILRYKEMYDEALYPLFFHGWVKHIHKHYRGYTLVVMPSSILKIEMRGFHHMQRMVEILKMPVLDLFEKTTDVEQKYLTRSERLQNRQMIRYKTDVVIPKTKYLLMDDICTTGNTLLAAYHLLQPYAGKVKAVVFAYNPILVKIRRTKKIEFQKGESYTQK